VADLISIVVSTFDRADALDAVLRALVRQTDRRFEVVIADDGSGPGTGALVEQWKPRLGASLSHVWHEHKSATGPSAPAGATIAFSSMAIAWCVAITSPLIVGSPSAAGSSPAIGPCWGIH
jgi:hypothetical protein